MRPTRWPTADWASNVVAVDIPIRTHSRLLGWLAPLAIALLALCLRLWHLGTPKVLAFDETYYAKDSWSLLLFGYARDAAEGANERILAGETTGIFTNEPTWVVHPDGGKWLIAGGIDLFGMTPFGWRFAAVVAGSLMVLVLARLTLRLTGSIAFACLAGLLLTIDGVHFVMSRLALLDIFLALWLLCMVACLAADRDWLKSRLDQGLPVGWFRGWQAAAGVCAGLAVSTKWSALWVIAAFGITLVLWEFAVRARPANWQAGAIQIMRIGLPAFGWLVVLGFFVYLATWSSWLAHHEVFETRFGHGYGDVPPWGDYINRTDGTWWNSLTDPLRSLWHFHVMTFGFHTGDYMAGVDHPYQSNPAGWLLQIRPTSVHTVTDVAASKCGAPSDSSCISEVLILGNPLVWWTSTVALAAAVVAWITTRSWVWSVPVVGVAATWIPWFFVGSRPIFTFYSVAILPFLILGLVLLLNALYQRFARPRWFWWVLAAFMAAVSVMSWWLWPLWTDGLLPYDAWQARMWFNSWI